MPTYPQPELDSLTQRLAAAPWIQFGGDMRGRLPMEGGIYRICDHSVKLPQEVYVGSSRNLRRRIYTNHFMGPAANSTLVRKIINDGLYHNAVEVHLFLGTSCAVQFLVIADERLRCFTEHYAVAILQPLYNN